MFAIMNDDGTVYGLCENESELQAVNNVLDRFGLFYEVIDVVDLRQLRERMNERLAKTKEQLDDELDEDDED